MVADVLVTRDPLRYAVSLLRNTRWSNWLDVVRCEF
jgi:hypothetical protein